MVYWSWKLHPHTMSFSEHMSQEEPWQLTVRFADGLLSLTTCLHTLNYPLIFLINVIQPLQGRQFDTFISCFHNCLTCKWTLSYLESHLSDWHTMQWAKQAWFRNVTSSTTTVSAHWDLVSFTWSLMTSIQRLCQSGSDKITHLEWVREPFNDWNLFHFTRLFTPPL